MANGSQNMVSDKARQAFYLQAPDEAGGHTDQYGNLLHNRGTNAASDSWNIKNFNGTSVVRVYWETGEIDGIGTHSITLPNGSQGEFYAIRGNVGVWMGIGSGNTNHGLYSDVKGDWMIYANSSGSVQVNGNAATATIWQTTRTFTVGATGKDVNGGANVSWSMNEIMGASDSSKFYRGDKTWSNTLVGNMTVQGNFYIGGSNSSNFISFHGLTGDNPVQDANHFFIGNRTWASSESSELVLFAGNDVGNGNSAVTASGSGPDRIRLIAGAHVFQTYSSAVSGAFETVCTSSALVNIFEINTNRVVTHKSIYIDQPSTARRNGIVGTYDYTKAAAIWAMGDSYQIATDGSGLGSLYGAAYGYAGQAYLSSRSLAGGHQFIWAENGDARVALGDGIWTKGTITLDKDAQICFYGKNNNTSPAAYVGYRASVTGVMHCKNTYGADGAFYIWSNGYNSGNDNGGIAIDNEGVTVFGAGDAGDNFTGVFRVINEDDVASGPVFVVKKAGACYFGKGQGYYISNDGSSYTGNAATATTAASCSGNAATTTKLQTARSLWGNSFDGTADISGRITLTSDTWQINFRNNDSYRTGFSYQTYGNEALLLATRQSVTSFIVANGVDPNSASSSQWTGVTPALQCKSGCVRIGGLWGHGTNPDYTLRVDGTVKHTGRLYQTNWIEFTDSSGLYLPSSGSGTHFYPANDVTYGSFQMIGAKGGYRGITMGTSNNDLTIMSDGTNEGLYNANKGRWIIYYHRTNDQIGIFGASVASGYNVRVNGSLYVNSTLYVPGGNIYTDQTVFGHGIWANRGNGECAVGVDAGTTGTLYFYSNGTNKGIYSGSGYRTGAVLTINSSSTTFYGKFNGDCTGNAATATRASTVGDGTTNAGISSIGLLSKVSWSSSATSARSAVHHIVMFNQSLASVWVCGTNDIYVTIREGTGWVQHSSSSGSVNVSTWGATFYRTDGSKSNRLSVKTNNGSNASITIISF